MAILRVIIDASGARRGSKAFVRSADEVARGATKAAVGVKRTDTAMAGLSKRLGFLGPQLKSTLITFAGIAGIAASVRAISNFEETLATVQGVARATDEQLESLEATAKRLGATTRFTASQAGEGLLSLARAGFSAEESIAALPATLDLAIAGQLELGQASEIAANAIRTFNLEADAAVQVADVFVAASIRSNTTVADMAQAFRLAAPTAAALGISIEEVSAALAVLANRGLVGSLGGTGLRGILLALAKPTRESRQAIEGLGLTIEQVTPGVAKLEDILDALSKTNLTAGQATRIFRRQQAGAALVLSRNAAEYAKLREEVTGTGDAARIAEIQNQTLAGSFRALLSATEAIVLALGEAGLAGAIKSAVDFTTALFRELAGVNVEGQKASETIQHLATAIKLTAKIAAAFVAIKIISFLVTLAIKIKVVTTAMLAFNVAVSANPIGLLVLALSAATIAAIELGGAIFGASEAVVEQETKVAKLATTWREANIALKEAFKTGDTEAQIEGLTAKIKAADEAFADINKRVREEARVFHDLASNVRFRSAGVGDEEILANRERAHKRRVERLSKQMGVEQAIRMSRRSAAARDDLTTVSEARDKARARANSEFVKGLITAEDAVKSFNLHVKRQADGTFDLLEVQQALIANITSFRRAQAEAEEAAERRRLEEQRLKDELQEAAALQDRLDKQRAEINARRIDFAKKARDAVIADFDARKKAREGIDASLDSIEKEIALTHAQGEAKIALATQFAILGQAKNADIELTEKQTDRMNKLIQRLIDAAKLEEQRADADRQVKAREDTIQSIENESAALQHQIVLLELEGETRLSAIAAFEAEQAARGETIAGTDEYTAALRKLIFEREKLREDLERKTEEKQKIEDLDEAAKKAGLSFADAEGQVTGFLTAITSGSQTARGALAALLQDLQRLALRAATSGLFSALGSTTTTAAAATSPTLAPNRGIGPNVGAGLIPRAYGGVIHPMALGDILRQSTIIQQRDGSFAQAGEGGEEGVLPLRRDRFGRLGVHAAGGGGGSSLNVTFNFGPGTRGSDVRRSSNQIVSRIEKAMRRSRHGLP